ncbi:MAG: N-acetylmuramoyl-L-alanine amidase [Paracoccaceae bacterium]
MVLHYTAMASAAEARARLCAPEHEVSAHWLIDRDGSTEQLVDEGLRAWHAGAGEWGGAGDVNSRSIGIELQNSGVEPFAEPQMAALEHLLAGILRRWDIPPQGVIAHSDMAPDRKTDPGPRFDWRRLALAGLSVWPELQGGAMRDGGAGGSFAADARAFGYPQAENLLGAFRLRFRPWASGPQDATDAALAAALARRYGAGRYGIDRAPAGA